MSIINTMVAKTYSVLCNLSPYIEVKLRQLYWRNISKTASLKKEFKEMPSTEKVEFKAILKFLSDNGIGKGSLIVVHSSYKALKGTGLSPEQINQALIDYVSKEGTVAMPVIREYKEEGSLTEYFTKNMDEVICTYDVEHSHVTTGILPYCLMRRGDSFTSRFPLNPMTAVGQDAEQMMIHNLEGNTPSPHGVNSAWKYCYDHYAMVVGLGIDQTHYLTIEHVAQESFENWPIQDWFRKRLFRIIDKDFQTSITVSERKPKWGAKYRAETKLKKDLLKHNILKIEHINGVEVSITDSRKLIDFLRANKKKGYPYYVPNKYIIK
ncbi:MAG: AAC(3) family N-acetyltransferase [Alistipes sp.]